MKPYYVAIVFGDDEMECHQVWAATESEAMRTAMCFYKDCTVMGILFGLEPNKE